MELAPSLAPTGYYDFVATTYDDASIAEYITLLWLLNALVAAWIVRSVSALDA